MESPLVTVPGSRRPVTVKAQGLVVDTKTTPAYTMSLSSSTTSTSSSTYRRKPKFTYKSPSSHGPGSLRVETPLNATPSLPSSSSSTATKNSTPHASGPTQTVDPPKSWSTFIKQPHRSVYHPLGRLALALPEIDPETFGLRNPHPITIDDPTRRSSSRARRPAAKLRESHADDGATGSPLAAPIDAAAPREKASPRKRRGAAQAGSKRKRREPDDGDGTYPAKRTRTARGAPAPALSDAGSPAHSVPPGAVDASEAGDAMEDSLKVPERRSTRARAAAARTVPARRNSSASEGTQTSVSASMAARAKEADAENGAAADSVGVSAAGSPEKAEAEESKASEESANPDAGMVFQPPDSSSTDAAKVPGAVEESNKAVPIVPLPPAQAPAKPEPEDQKEEGELSEDGEIPSTT